MERPYNVIVLSILAAFLLLTQKSTTPSFHVAWSVPFEKTGRMMAVKDRTEISCLDNVVLATDLKKGTRVWSHVIRSEGSSLSVGVSDSNSLYVVLDDRQLKLGDPSTRFRNTGAIIQLDLKTGKQLRKIVADVAGPCTVDNEIAYFADSAGALTAMNLGTSQTLWASPVGKPGQMFRTSQPVITPKSIVVEALLENDIVTWIAAFDRLNGKRLWVKDTAYPRQGLPLYAEGVIVLSSNGIVGVDPASGRQVWRVPTKEGDCNSAAFASGMVVCCVPRVAIAIEPHHGKLLWKRQLQPRESAGFGIYVYASRSALYFSDHPFAAFSMKGDKFWHTDNLEGELLWTDGATFAISDGSSTKGYVLKRSNHN